MFCFVLFLTALKSPKPAAEPAAAVTTPVTVPVVGKKAGIYVYSTLFKVFLSEIPKYLQEKENEELYNCITHSLQEDLRSYSRIWLF